MHDREEMTLSRRSLLAGAVVPGVTGSMLGSTRAFAKGEPAPKNRGPAPNLFKLEHVQVEPVAPPFVHAHEQSATGRQRVVQFRRVIEEKRLVIDDDGTEIHAMTFNGSVPVPLMVVNQEDYVEPTLVNPASNTLTHNIDFHASTGALGGGALTIIQPGEEVKLRFRASRPGARGALSAGRRSSATPGNPPPPAAG